MYNRIHAITKVSFIEQLRNYPVILMSWGITAFFIGVSILMSNIDALTAVEKKMIISSQFFSGALIILIVSYGFSNVLTSTVEKKENQTFIMLNQANVKFFEYLIGTTIAGMILFNANIIAAITMFGILVEMSTIRAVEVIIFCNLTTLVLIPLAYIFSSKIMKVIVANSISTVFLLLMVFSLTFTTMFGSLIGKDINTLLKFLFWNPLVYFYDVFLYATNVKTTFFLGSIYYDFLAVFTFAVVLIFIAVKMFKSGERR